jgi:mannose-6-phosphate isomerase-like protein (cupin superfamily)
MRAINIQEKFRLFSDLWSPKKIGELNGQQVLLAKLKGAFLFHKHDHEDELFMVMKGSLDIEFRDKTITLNEGEFYIVPKGIEHKPIATEEVHLLLFEPLSIKHTGNIVADITVETYESI